MGKPTIHTTISEKHDKILDFYANLKDENNELIFGKKSKVIEKALDLLDSYYNPQKDNLQFIWNRARKELNMVLVGKRTFLSYISGNHQKALEENIAIDIIEWYKADRIENLDLKETLEAIKCIWLAANYFYKVDLEIGSKGSFQMTFYHDFHSEQYSSYWGKYFSALIENNKNVEVEIFARTSTLILRISPIIR